MSLFKFGSPWEKLIEKVKSFPTAEIRKNFAEVQQFVQESRRRNRILATRYGDPVLGVVSVYDIAVLEALDQEAELFSKLKQKHPELQKGP